MTTLQPKSLLITQRREQQFSEVSTPEMIMLQRQLNTSNLGAQVENQSDTQSEHIEAETQSETLVPTERVKCLFCPNLYTKRGMTKHVNKQHPHQ